METINDLCRTKSANPCGIFVGIRGGEAEGWERRLDQKGFGNASSYLKTGPTQFL
jgi:hypothetical protein